MAPNSSTVNPLDYQVLEQCWSLITSSSSSQVNDALQSIWSAWPPLEKAIDNAMKDYTASDCRHLCQPTVDIFNIIIIREKLAGDCGSWTHPEKHRLRPPLKRQEKRAMGVGLQPPLAWLCSKYTKQKRRLSHLIGNTWTELCRVYTILVMCCVLDMTVVVCVSCTYYNIHCQLSLTLLAAVCL